MPCPEWLVALPKDQIPQPEKFAFPLPERGKDGQFIFVRPPSDEPVESTGPPKVPISIINNVSPNMIRKRAYDQQNGLHDGIYIVQVLVICSNSHFF